MSQETIDRIQLYITLGLAFVLIVAILFTLNVSIVAAPDTSSGAPCPLNVQCLIDINGTIVEEFSR